MKTEFINTGVGNGSIDHPVYRAIVDTLEQMDCDSELALVPTRPFYGGAKPWRL